MRTRGKSRPRGRVCRCRAFRWPSQRRNSRPPSKRRWQARRSRCNPRQLRQANRRRFDRRKSCRTEEIIHRDFGGETAWHRASGTRNRSGDPEARVNPRIQARQATRSPPPWFARAGFWAGIFEQARRAGRSLGQHLAAWPHAHGRSRASQCPANRECRA
jgi:hypothetical protein